MPRSRGIGKRSEEEKKREGERKENEGAQMWRKRGGGIPGIYKRVSVVELVSVMEEPLGTRVTM